MLTAIISPGMAGIVLLVVLAGGYLMNRIIQKKYGYTPEREKKLEEAEEEGVSDDRSHSSCEKKHY